MLWLLIREAFRAYAFGPLTPAFIAVAGLGMVGLVYSLGTVLDAEPTPGYPRRSMIALLVAIPLLLVVMWSGRIAATLPASGRGGLMGYTTMPVQVMGLWPWRSPAAWRRRTSCPRCSR